MSKSVKNDEDKETIVTQENVVVEETTNSDNDIDEIMRKYDKESNTRIWEGIPKIFVVGFMAIFSLYCMYMTLFSTVLPETRLSLFLGFIIVIGFLNYPISKKHVKPNSLPWYDLILMIVGAGSFFYYAFNALSIIKMTANTGIQVPQVIIGTIGLIILVELCRRCVGLPILIVAGCLLGYAFYNQFVYGATFYQALRQIISKLFYSTNGVIGTPTNVCYTYIVLFIIFGAFLERTGISNCFIAFANRIAGRTSGGPAKVAVISSALCGMVSGSSVGNTVTTGSVTIPMMKKTGYKPEFAGAVEAAASTGGQIMPPIMGAAAFLMAEYVGLPYSQIALKAILPALLYFLGIFISVHLEAKKLNLKGVNKEDLPKWSFLLKNSYLILPLVLLVWLVASGARTMAFSAAISIFAALFIGFIHLLVTDLNERKGQKFIVIAIDVCKKTCRMTGSALYAGAKGAITVAVACAIAGVIAGCITVTGLASILINGIVKVAGNATIIGLVLTMFCCIILGMGVPTTANYCIMASTCAPILVQLGFPQVAAHFFVFYFGIVADITPPVALAAYAGSAIAKSNPMKTGINATRLAIAAFIVPYIFVYSPSMLLVNTVWYQVILIVVTALLGIFGVSAGLTGYIFAHLNVVFRCLLVVGGLTLLHPGIITDIIGFSILTFICICNYVAKRKNIETLQN